MPRSTELRDSRARVSASSAHCVAVPFALIAAVAGGEVSSLSPHARGQGGWRRWPALRRRVLLEAVLVRNKERATPVRRDSTAKDISVTHVMIVMSDKLLSVIVLNDFKLHGCPAGTVMRYTPPQKLPYSLERRLQKLR